MKLEFGNLEHKAKAHDAGIEDGKILRAMRDIRDMLKLGTTVAELCQYTEDDGRVCGRLPHEHSSEDWTHSGLLQLYNPSLKKHGQEILDKAARRVYAK